jgi:hypothetical protein
MPAKLEAFRKESAEPRTISDMLLKIRLALFEGVLSKWTMPS